MLIVKIRIKCPELAAQALFVTLKFDEEETAMSALTKVAHKLKLQETPEELRQKFAFHVDGTPSYLQFDKCLSEYGFYADNPKMPQLFLVQHSTRVTLVGLDNDARPTRIDFNKERELESLLSLLAQEYDQREKDMQFVIAKHPDRDVSLVKSLLSQGVAHDDVILLKSKKKVKPKTRVQKVIQRKRKGLSSSSSKKIKGAALLGIGDTLPAVMHDAMSWIEVKAIQTPDIFHLSGKLTDIEPLLKAYESGSGVNLDDSPDPFVVCGLLLESLRALPGSIIPSYALSELNGLYSGKIMDIPKTGAVFRDLPVPNVVLLKHVVAFLHRVTEHADQNRMTAERLATIFGCILSPKAENPQHRINVLSELITKPQLLSKAQKNVGAPLSCSDIFLDGLEFHRGLFSIREVAAMVPAETIHLLIEKVSCQTPKHTQVVGKLFLTNYKIFFTSATNKASQASMSSASFVSALASEAPAAVVSSVVDEDGASALPKRSMTTSPACQTTIPQASEDAFFTFSIELAALVSIEKKSRDGVAQSLKIVSKSGGSVTLSLATQADFQHVWDYLRHFQSPQSMCKLFAFTYGLHDMEHVGNGPSLLTVEQEFERQGTSIPMEWRYYSSKSFKKYPEKVLIPSSLWEDVLLRAANAYTDNRFPTLVWQDKNTKSCVLLSGAKKKSELAASNLSSSLSHSASSTDLRSSAGFDATPASLRTSAMANSGAGEDTDQIVLLDSIRTILEEDAQLTTILLLAQGEKKRGATQSVFTFASVHNVYAKLLEALSQTTEPSSDLKVGLVAKEWLSSINEICSAAAGIVGFLKGGASVVVEDDGLVYYSVISLALLLLDPFYRTIEGFASLVQHVWIRFQFPFGKMSGVGAGQFSHEGAAPFVQWMDCVWQVIAQFPTKFEYDEKMLTFVLSSLFSGRFGTFIANSEKEAGLLDNKTISVWDHLVVHRKDFTNAFFCKEANASSGVLRPTTDLKVLNFWVGHFLSWPERENVQKAFWKIKQYQQLPAATPTPLDLSSMELPVVPQNIARLRETRKGRKVLTKLVLSQNNLRSFPHVILALSNLQTIDLSGNGITSLSEDVCGLLSSFKKLSMLNLANNSLGFVHSSVSSLTNLYSLTLGGTGSRSFSLPDSLFTMTSLRSFDLHNFSFSGIPETITTMTNLEFLSLRSNHISNVSALGKATFPNLRAILLQDNDIEDLKCEQLDVPELQLLNLSKNKLKGVILPVLCTLSSCIELILSENKITRVPAAIVRLESLRSLDLRGNALKVPICPSVGFMPRLEQLDFSENPIAKVIEYEDTLSLLAEMRETLNFSVKPYRTRLMIVGQENVGKSTLAAALKKTVQGSTLQNLSTDGISMNEWQVKTQFEGETKQVSLKLWDFAGQEIYYCTHQLFLVDDAIYVLVCNIMDMEVARIEFWLHSIKARSNATVILVGTHIDHERCSKDYLGQTLEALAKKYAQKFPQLKKITAVSCVSGKGISELRGLIKDVLPQHSFVSAEVPNAVLLLELEIIAMRETMSPPVISWSGFMELAKLFRLEDEETVEKAAKTLHSWGTIVHHADPNFNDIVVLDPKWLTEVLATIVTTKHRYIKDGILLHTDLPQIWHSSAYPEEMHPSLMRLLQRFEILYPLKEVKTKTVAALASSSSKGDASPRRATGGPRVDLDSWRDASTLVPCLLPAARPADVDTRFPRFEPGPQLCRVYQLDFVPIGLLNHLIVRVMQNSMDPIFWRNGICASSHDAEVTNNKVLLEHVQGTSSLRVSTRGSNPTNFFLKIVDIVDSFMACWYSLDLTILAPCPHCYRQKSYDPHMFPLDLCKQAALRGDAYMDCSISGSSVRLDTLAPDLSMAQVTRIEYSELENKVEIGKGGFATVYKADLQGEVVAVKQLDIVETEDGQVSNEAFDDFMKETWIMSGIEHANIIGFRGLCMKPLCIVTDFAPHGNLYDFLHSESEEQKAMASDWMLKLKIAFDVAGGMRFLHNRVPPLIHSDLKSPNILLVSTNPSDAVVAVVADFGLSTKWVPVLQGRKVDNPVWLAPEIIKGKEYTEKADVYAFGVILYEILTLKPFFSEFRFFSEMEDAIVAGKRPELPSDINALLLDLIEDCWAEDTHIRPTFDEIISRLEEVVIEEQRQGRVNLASFDLAKMTSATTSSSSLTAEPQQLSVDLSSAYVVGETAFAFDFEPRHSVPVSCMTVVQNGEGDDPEHDRIWAACDDGTVTVWVGSESLKRDDYYRDAVLPMHSSTISSILAAGDTVWTSCPEEKVVKVWCSRTTRLLRVLHVRHEILCLSQVGHEVWGGTPEGIILYWPLVSKTEAGEAAICSLSVPYIRPPVAPIGDKAICTGEFLEELIAKLSDPISGVTRHHVKQNRILRPNCFSGANLVSWIMAQFPDVATTRAIALEIAVLAHAQNRIHHCMNAGPMVDDAEVFFRIAPVVGTVCTGLVYPAKAKGSNKAIGIHLPTLCAEDKQHAASMSTSISVDVQAIGSIHYDHFTELVWVGAARHVLVLDWKRKTIAAVIEGHRQLVTCIVGTKKHIWSCSQDKKINIYAKDGSVVKSIMGHTAAVVSLVHFRGEIWSASRDKSIIVWSASTFEFLREIKGRHEEPIVHLAAHHRKDHILSASRDRTICAWHVDPQGQKDVKKAKSSRRASIALAREPIKKPSVHASPEKADPADRGLLSSSALAALRELEDPACKSNFALFKANLEGTQVRSLSVKHVDMRHVQQQFSKQEPAFGILRYGSEEKKLKMKGKNKNKAKAKKLPPPSTGEDAELLVLLCNPENAPPNTRMCYSSVVEPLETALKKQLDMPVNQTVLVHNPEQLTETFIRFEYERNKAMAALHLKTKESDGGGESQSAATPKATVHLVRSQNLKRAESTNAIQRPQSPALKRMDSVRQV